VLNCKYQRENIINKALIMVKQYKIYLDVCCFNRPYDDQTQSRIRLETEGILEIINRCQSQEWLLFNSTAIESEIAQTPNQDRQEEVKECLLVAHNKILVTQEIAQRAINLTTFGLKNFDALHLACAENNTDVFLTTDDRLLRKALSYKDDLKVRVANPIIWLIEVTNNMTGE
jgi:predicted nucleic acid-binding protein